MKKTIKAVKNAKTAKRLSAAAPAKRRPIKKTGSLSFRRIRKITGSPKRIAASPRKTAAWLNRRELEAIKKKLLTLREELIRVVNEKRKLDLSEPEVGDGADQASQSLEKEILFELSDNERVMLDQIESALRRIEKKTYGLCESCRKPITKERIRAIPSARYCIACQSSNEISSLA
ncbi:MAG: TraR/DksA family transcriptional regulator [bacterium]